MASLLFGVVFLLLEPVQELDHEEAVSKSLESALHHTLQGLQMFTRKGNSIDKKPILTQATITKSDPSKLSLNF